MKPPVVDRIGIFVYYPGSLKFHPSIINTAQVWNDHGYKVDIFKCINPDEGVEQSDALRIVHVCQYESNPFARMISFYYFVKKSRSYMSKRSYKALIGIDAYGITIAGILNWYTKTTLIYHSLEILTTRANYDSVRKKSYHVRLGYIVHHKIAKIFEKIFHKKAFLTIIQDYNRWELLKRVNGLAGNTSHFIVPNTPMMNEGNFLEGRNGDYLADKHGLPKDGRIVLYAGGLAEWTGVDRILQDIERWPEKVAFVIHGRGPDDYINLLKRMIHGCDRKVILSLDQLVEKQYNTLVKSAHIGIAWYTDIKDPNTYYIGAASGKLFNYLKYGLPVITNKWPGLIEVVEDNAAGRCAASEADIGPMIEDILNNYDTYSNNARKCFEKYEYSHHYKHVVDAVVQLRTSDFD